MYMWTYPHFRRPESGPSPIPSLNPESRLIGTFMKKKITVLAPLLVYGRDSRAGACGDRTVLVRVLIDCGAERGGSRRAASESGRARRRCPCVSGATEGCRCCEGHSYCVDVCVPYVHHLRRRHRHVGRRERAGDAAAPCHRPAALPGSHHRSG
jgi:hypothetical protein